MKYKLLQEVLRISRNKNTKELHDQWGHYHHFSFLIWEGKVLKWATNKSNAPNISFGYAPTSKTHAEHEVIRKAIKWDLNKSIIINIRLNKFGQTRLSAPCKVCKQYMKRNGIKDVYYSIENDEFERLKL